MTEYRFVKLLSDKVVGLKSTYGEQLFTVRRARKRVKGCSGCGDPIEKGVLCWGPITNGMNRMERLCGVCVMDIALRGV